MKIDAHQHFWALDRGDYGWLKPESTVLYRDFGPGDLAPLLRERGIDGTVLVQAAPTVAETEYMLSLADQCDFILGVVGWVDFDTSDGEKDLLRLARHPKMVGLRPMIQDIDATDWMLQDHLRVVFEALIAQDLAFDALILPQHLPNLKTLCQWHPALRIVIDHGSKPAIAAGSFEPWAMDMACVAKDTQACVKLSGLVTEAGANWSVADLQPYVDHLLQHFGADRILWGSDWPVCTLAASYAKWWSATQTLLSACSDTERAAIEGGTARHFYKLKGTRDEYA